MTVTGYNGKQEIDVGNSSMGATNIFPRRRRGKVINAHITRKHI
jgi:hypothetical protein